MPKCVTGVSNERYHVTQDPASLEGSGPTGAEASGRACSLLPRSFHDGTLEVTANFLPASRVRVLDQ